jgi:hypothetical protein
MRAYASSVSTCVSVARIAVSDRTFAASVPPTPPTSESSMPIAASMRAATSSVKPYAADGMPLPIALPTVSTSGSSPFAAVNPPGPEQSVCVSSITSSVPYLRVNARSASWKPGSAWTMPMFVNAGSASTHATSPCASARSRASMSFHSTTRVVSSSGTGGPRLPSRSTTAPPSSVANVSSTVPW